MAAILPSKLVSGCSLCEEHGGILLWSDAQWRLVRVEDKDFPAFYRLVSRSHVAEFSTLSAEQRRRCMDLVSAVDGVLIETLRPTKINLAALGNMVPHLHWHVIARFGWDSHFPQPIWGSRQREVDPPAADRLALSLNELDRVVTAAIQAV